MCAGLSDLIESLTNTALEPASKTAIVEDCQRGLSDLSKQIQDNANIIPAHDLRMYSKVRRMLYRLHMNIDSSCEVIQGLTEKFERVRRDSGPKRRFQFKSASIKVKNDVSMKGLAHSTIPADISDTPQTQSLERSDVPGVGGHGSDPGNSEAALPKCPAIAGKGLQIQSLYDEFYVTAAQDLESTMMIRDVHRSLIDVSLATTERMSLSTLAISDVSYSLLLCGTIAGAAHVTGLRGTTVVLHSGQLRAHNCIDCAFYLVCSSRPIIEHCKDLRFGPIPSSLVSNQQPA